MNRDLAFLGRHFETADIPKDKLYLLKYFKTAVQRAFLRYYLVFGDVRNFTDHTGIHCSGSWAHDLSHKLAALEAAHAAAKQLGDLENLALSKIESGKYKCGK